MKIFVVPRLLLLCGTLFVPGIAISQDTKVATFADALDLDGGLKGDLQILFQTDAQGAISQPRLRVLSDTKATPLANYCRQICSVVDGKLYCIWSCVPTVGGPLRVPPPGTLLDVAVEFDTIGTDLEVKLFKNPATVDLLMSRVEAAVE